MKNNNYSPIVLGDTDPYLKDNTGRRICRNGAYVPSDICLTDSYGRAILDAFGRFQMDEKKMAELERTWSRWNNPMDTWRF